MCECNLRVLVKKKLGYHQRRNYGLGGRMAYRLCIYPYKYFLSVFKQINIMSDTTKIEDQK